MPRYWWVNHKQTVRYEVGDGYLWSPKRENGGAYSQFYENMRIADPGDIILSFADTWIKHVGLVESRCISAPKPTHLGTTGAYWAEDGWWLPVKWFPLPTPVRPKDFADHLASLLPKKYSLSTLIKSLAIKKHIWPK